LIHGEVSEAMEADRRGEGWDRVTEELADVCIRIFDLCGSMNLNLEKAIVEKMEYNKTRPYKHGGKSYYNVNICKCDATSNYFMKGKLIWD
jgi:NTP pyrophosphatase (non-canonical NTP hydrolase)